MTNRIREMDVNIITEGNSVFRKNTIIEVEFLFFGFNEMKHGDRGGLIASFVTIVTMFFPHFMKNSVDYRVYFDNNVGVSGFSKNWSRIVTNT